MAISAESLKLSPSKQVAEPSRNTFLKRLVDEGSVYVPQALSVPQFATLYAILKRLVRWPQSAVVEPSHLAENLDANLASDSSASRTPRSRAYPLGLDELDMLVRTHAGYAFAELTPELQDAVLELIVDGDLTTKRLNLAVWLEDLRNRAVTDGSSGDSHP